MREVAIEILRYDPEAGPVTLDSFAVITSQLNSRIRNRGLSSWEILHQRDQESGHQLPFIDQELSKLQSEKRKTNQIASAKHKAQGGPSARPADVQLGSLVYIKKEGDKTKPRDRYIVTDISDNFCTVQKFINNQLRSRPYKVKLTDIFPVSSDLFEYDGLVRGFPDYDSDCSDEADSTVLPPASQRVLPPALGSVSNQYEDNMPSITPHNVMELSETVIEEVTATKDDRITTEAVLPPERSELSQHQIDNETETEHLSQKRPQHTRHKPSWMTSGNFVCK